MKTPRPILPQAIENNYGANTGTAITAELMASIFHRIREGNPEGQANMTIE